MLYSQKGGLKSVIWTEALQGAILVGGALICLIVLYWGMPEGPEQAIKICLEHNKFSLGSFDGSLVESTILDMSDIRNVHQSQQFCH